MRQRPGERESSLFTRVIDKHVCFLTSSPRPNKGLRESEREREREREREGKREREKILCMIRNITIPNLKAYSTQVINHFKVAQGCELTACSQ